MKFIYSCLALLCAIQSISHSQSETPVDEFEGFKSAISIVPQYAAISGIRIDYERKIKNGKQWIQLGPQIYLDNNGYNNFSKLTGYGMNAYYKMYLFHSKRKNTNGLARTTLYFSTGPTFQHYNLVSTEEVPYESVELGITYIRFASTEVTTKINKFGGSAIFGMQFTFDRFLLDLYGGIGIRYSVDEDGNMVEFFNDDWIDLGYSGILLEGGIRLGFFIH
jgi:hypothetical protein